MVHLDPAVDVLSRLKIQRQAFLFRHVDSRISLPLCLSGFYRARAHTFALAAERL